MIKRVSQILSSSPERAHRILCHLLFWPIPLSLCLQDADVYLLILHRIGEPLRVEGFPALLTSGWTCAISLLAILLISFLRILLSQKPALISLACALLPFQAVLNLHTITGQDASHGMRLYLIFALLYVSAHQPPLEVRQLRMIRRYGVGVLSVFFLAGALGKLTPSYCSGEVFSAIFLHDDRYPVFTWLQDTFEADTLSQIMQGFSLGTIVVEAIAATCVLWRSQRLAQAFLLSVVLSMLVLLHPARFDVMAIPMLCLVAASFVADAALRRPDAVSESIRWSPA